MCFFNCILQDSTLSKPLRKNLTHSDKKNNIKGARVSWHPQFCATAIVPASWEFLHPQATNQTLRTRKHALCVSCFLNPCIFLDLLQTFCFVLMGDEFVGSCFFFFFSAKAFENLFMPQAPSQEPPAYLRASLLCSLSQVAPD